MNSPKSCVIVGAGLTGATAACELARQGFRVRVYERADVIGGHVRTEWLRGIPYEPHGAHIFHTDDTAVWNLVSKYTDFVPYQHRVTIRVRSHQLSWPLQRSELSRLEEWPQVERELSSLPPEPDTTNFATYCRSLMGQTLYDLCVRNYTMKQWGRAPEELSASVAVNRVELRDDDYRGLFRDRHQGWPERGYTDLVENLLDSAEIHLGSRSPATTWPRSRGPASPSWSRRHSTTSSAVNWARWNGAGSGSSASSFPASHSPRRRWW